jgi:hypothetical protein
MSNQIPDSHKELFEKPIIASLATTMPNGQPQVNPVWCDYDGTHGCIYFPRIISFTAQPYH